MKLRQRRQEKKERQKERSNVKRDTYAVARVSNDQIAL